MPRRRTALPGETWEAIRRLNGNSVPDRDIARQLGLDPGEVSDLVREMRLVSAPDIWSAEQDRLILAMRNQHGRLWSAIAAAVERDTEAVQDRHAYLTRHRVPVLPTTRTCLDCRAVFTSEGRHNRLCGTCRAHSGADQFCATSSTHVQPRRSQY